MVDGAVAFMHRVGGVACHLELPVHIAGEHAQALVHARAPALQLRKARVGHRAAVQRQPVAVKPQASSGA